MKIRVSPNVRKLMTPDDTRSHTNTKSYQASTDPDSQEILQSSKSKSKILVPGFAVFLLMADNGCFAETSGKVLGKGKGLKRSKLHVSKYQGVGLGGWLCPA